MLLGKIVIWCYSLPRIFISAEKDHELVKDGQWLIRVCFAVFSVFSMEL